MAGKYGEVRQPLCVDGQFDYVLFSNDFKESSVGVWQVRPIPIPDEIDAADNKRISRYPKTHPETLLAEYEASLYIDANIQIVDKWVYDRVLELDDQGIDYAGVKLHVTGRDCIYRHAYDMCLWGVEHDYVAIRQMHHMYKEGFPEHFGMNENNVIFRRHNERMKKVDEMWWQQIVQYSFRDQFSYMYCLWKNEIPKVYFLPEDTDARCSEHFKLTQHDGNEHVKKQKFLNVGFLEYMRNQCRKLSSFHRKLYREQWLLFIKMPMSQIWLITFGILSSIIWSPVICVKWLKGCAR